LSAWQSRRFDPPDIDRSRLPPVIAAGLSHIPRSRRGVALEIGSSEGTI
jgi:hypothetical protein